MVLSSWPAHLPPCTVLPNHLVECSRDSKWQLHLVQLLDRHVPLSRFRYMSTVMICHRVWPEVSLLRTLYDEGILSSHMKLRGVAHHTRHTVVYSSPTTLVTDLVDPLDVGAYLLAPKVDATYHITNSSAPHTVWGVPRYTCLWEVGWKGDGVLEYFAFWSPVGAPRAVLLYAAVMYGLFKTLAKALGQQCKRVYRLLVIALGRAPA